MTTRRGFLGAILAAGVAPAVVGSGILMPVREIVLPDRWDALARARAEHMAKAMRKTKDVVIAATSGLQIGDRFTVAGMNDSFGGQQLFTVSAVQGAVITLQAA